MKKRKFLLPTLLVVSLAAVSLTACNRHSHDPEDRAEWMVHKISKKLDLDESQKARLEDVKVEILKQHNAHRQSKMVAIDKLIAEVEKPQIDETLLMELVNEHKSNIDQAAPSVIEKLVAFHAALSPEQKKEVAEKLQEFKKRHHSDEK